MPASSPNTSPVARPLAASNNKTVFELLDGPGGQIAAKELKEKPPKYEALFSNFVKHGKELYEKFVKTNTALSKSERKNHIDSEIAVAEKYVQDLQGLAQLPANHLAKSEKLYEDFMAGKSSKFKDRHRSNAPDQDEHFSTASIAGVLGGIKKARGSTQASKEVDRAFQTIMSKVFAAISFSRAPTQFTYAAVEASTPTGPKVSVSMQHPTAKNVSKLKGGNTSHNAADRERAAAVDKTIEQELTKPTSPEFSVVAVMLKALWTAQVVTAKTMSLPSQASNTSNRGREVKKGTVDITVQQTKSREMIKNMAAANPERKRNQETGVQLATAPVAVSQSQREISPVRLPLTEYQKIMQKDQASGKPHGTGQNPKKPNTPTLSK